MRLGEVVELHPLGFPPAYMSKIRKKVLYTRALHNAALNSPDLGLVLMNKKS